MSSAKGEEYKLLLEGANLASLTDCLGVRGAGGRPDEEMMTDSFVKEALPFDPMRPFSPCFQIHG